MKNITTSLVGRAGMCCALALVQQTPVTAQDTASSSGLEEITVTARKTTESLLDVPVAVNVVGAEALRNALVTDLTKVAETVPQVTIGTVSTGAGAVLTIRGISSSPLDAGIDQSVSVAIDGVQLSRGRVLSQTLFDVRQVEVLQGPQALFFGKNSPAGVINIESNTPTGTFESTGRMGYELEAAERYIDGAVSGPLTDTLNARFALRASRMRGWIENDARPQADPFGGADIPGAADGHAPKGDNVAGRVSLDWHPVEDFSAQLRFMRGAQSINGGDTTVEAFCRDGVTQLTSYGVVDPQGDCKADKHKDTTPLPAEYLVNYPYAKDGEPYMDSTYNLGSLRLDRRLGDFNLTAVTGYYKQTVQDTGDYDVTSLATVFDAERESYRLWNEEVRLTSNLDGPVDFTLGAYFEHSKRFFFNAPFVVNVGIDPATGSYTALQSEASSSGDVYSGFAQIRWQIVDAVELAAGARWTQEKKDISIGNTSVNPYYASLGAFLPAGQFIEDEYKDDDISPEVTVTWHPTDESTLYAGYKTGYKSGGFSNAVLQGGYTADTLRFKNEDSQGAEVGYKAELPQYSLRYEVTAYRYGYRNLQVTAFNAETIGYTIRNAASARTQGVQGSFEWAAGSGVTITGAVGYNRARFRDFDTAQCYSGQTVAAGCIDGVQDLSGEPLPRAPKLSANLGGNYELPLVGSWSANLSLSTSYSASYRIGEDADPGLVQNSFWLWNAAARVHRGEGSWELALIGRNLTDKYYAIAGNSKTSGSPGEYAAWFNRPREVVLQLGYSF